MTASNGLDYLASRSSRAIVDTVKNMKTIRQSVEANRHPSLANNIAPENAALILDRLASFV